MWFYYALGFALWSSTATLIIKKLTGVVNPLTILYSMIVSGVIFTFLLLQFVGGIPSATNYFYIFILCSSILDSIAFIANFKAISMTDISLLAPFSSFSPVFTTIIAIYTLGESPTPIKFVGILLVVLGSYLLNISAAKNGLLAPIKKLFSNNGVRLVLLSNLIWAVTPILQKKAIFETHPQIPLFASFMGMFFGLFLLAPFALPKAISEFKKIRRQIKWFGVLGTGTAFSQLAAYTAFALANVGYVTSILRLSSIFTIILGGVVLKEKDIKERLFGAAVMVVGAIIIAI